MRKFPVLVLIAVLFTALLPANGKAQRTKVPTTLLPGYTVRDTNFSRKDFNVWLVTTSLYFDSLFVAQDSMAPRPNFDESFVIAVKAETYSNKYKTNYRETYLQRKILRIYFTVSKDKPNKEEYGWVSLMAFPRDKTIRRVNFYHDDMLIKSIPVVIVY